MTNVADTLAGRGVNYGRYETQAQISQGIKDAMRMHPGWERLADDQKESLEMIANKVGRILNGNPDYADSWHDIAGYAKLIDDRLQGYDSNRKSKLADPTEVPAVKTWHAVPVNEFGVPLPDLQEPISFGGTD